MGAIYNTIMAEVEEGETNLDWALYRVWEHYGNNFTQRRDA